MLVETIRQLGQKGTAKLVERFGERLVCVRYRFDHEKRKRYKTAEIIIQEMDWHGAAPSPNAPRPPASPTTPLVPLRIGFDEKDLQRQIKAIGGQWNREERVWYAPEAYVRRIGLMGRVVKKVPTSRTRS